MRKKIMPCFIVIVILASIFSGCIEEKMPESTDQKSAKGEWQPHIPSYTQPDIPDYGGAIDHAIDISEGVSQIGEEHNARMNQLANDIGANNDRIDQWSKEHNARINEIEKQSICITEHAERVGKKSTEISEQMQDYNSRMDGHIKKITKQNADVCENIKVLQSYINEIASKSTKDAERMRDYNVRLEGHIKKIESQNARIDAWAKEHNTRMNELTGDIAAQNAEIYEASIKAQEHINELNKLTNGCLNDLLHIYAGMAILPCGIPGSVISVGTKHCEYVFKTPDLEHLSKGIGWIQTTVSAMYFVGGDYSRLSEQIGTKISQNILNIFTKQNENTKEMISKSLKAAEQMKAYNANQDELLASVTDRNAQIGEYMQDYNAKTNRLIVEIIRMIEDVEA